MPNPRKPFRLNVGFLVSATVGVYRDFDFAFEKIALEDGFNLTNFEGIAKISRTPQGLLIEGNFSGSLPLQCVRCLKDVPNEQIAWEFTELYAFSKDNETDSGLIVPDDAHIELEPIIRDYALLEVPTAPLCKPDCLGLCIECGQNLNENDCGHSESADDDSPFSKLKSTLKD